jgi:hypothetical protein
MCASVFLTNVSCFWLEYLRENTELMSFHAPIFQFSVAAMRVPSRLDIKDMNQKLPAEKLNRNSSNTFEIHVKVPKAGEFNLKLHPQTWHQITRRLKTPLLWWLIVMLGGNSVILLRAQYPPALPPQNHNQQ